MQPNQDSEATLFNKEERKFISKTLICKYTQSTLDYKSIFGVLFFPDPSYLIDLTLTNLNCLYGEKLKLSFALINMVLFIRVLGWYSLRFSLGRSCPNLKSPCTLLPTKICDLPWPISGLSQKSLPRFGLLKLLHGTSNRASSEFSYKSNRPQVSMVYRHNKHLGCWKNSRRIRKSRRHAPLVTSFMIARKDNRRNN